MKVWKLREWPERSCWGGKFQPIKELLKAGSHKLEIWGNGSDGWQTYLVSGNAGVPLSPLFHRDFGDTMKALKEATQRAYGVVPSRGRSWV